MENKIDHSPNYWLLPVVFPLAIIITILTRILEKLFPIKGDPLAFLLIAKKLAPVGNCSTTRTLPISLKFQLTFKKAYVLPKKPTY